MEQVRVNLMFDANVNAARSNIQQLATLLQQIATPKTVVVNGGAIQQAAQAAQSLQMHLQSAMNVNTGKLDLTKLNTSLKQSGQSLSELSSKLVASGTQGQQAFSKLANAIATAGAPAATLNSTITQFMKTMGSAIMWSAAYGALNKVTEVISDAVSYAKDLNKALTEIAIVSGMTAEQLDSFAVKAEKAARKLNSTTIEYAKAALIFYQQGLSGKEVEERANVVTKLAQVTGQAAESVSSQLTSIWNNFDDGSKTLEYYADALTALGAATAASTDEITQGLEKFAAVAETAGLSYEYATAALATVVDKTRQSADVVGTAFKTLFARIADLELGETLEDGVTLGNYSQALAAVGVDILNTNGELKDMDNILDEVGAKWSNLGRAQQTALAQTVAGIRQYTQFIAIMDNYEDFKLNVSIAQGAEGTLDSQWSTWEKSFDAASKRVEQRASELYGSLLKDDFVIGVTDGFANIIEVIGNFSEAMGGLGPIILTIIMLFSNKLIPVIANAATTFISNLSIMTGAAQRQTAAIQNATKAQIQELINSKLLSTEMAESLNLTSELITTKQRLAEATKNLTAVQQQAYQQQMSMVEASNLEVQSLIQLQAERSRSVESLKTRLSITSSGRATAAGKDFLQNQATSQEEIARAQKELSVAKGARTRSTTEDAIARNDARVAAAQKNLDEQNRRTIISDEQRQRITDSLKTSTSMTKKIVGTSTFDTPEEGMNLDAMAMRRNFLNQKMGMTEIGSDTDITGLTNVDTSIENLEKVINTSARLKTGMEEVNQLSQELEASFNKFGAAAEGSLSEEEKAEIDKIAASYKKLANELGLTDADLEELSGDFEKLKQGGKTAQEASENIKSRLKELGVQCDLFSGDLDQLAVNMLETFKQGGMSAKELDELFNQLIELAGGSEEVRTKLERLRQSMQSLDDSVPTMTRGQAFSQLAGQVGQAAGAVSMAVGAFQMLSAAMDETADPGTRLMSLVSGLSMLLPALTMMLNQNSISTTANALAAMFGAKVKEAEAGATGVSIIMKNGETASNWILKLSQDALNGSFLASLAIFGLVLVALAAIALVIVGVVAGVKALINWWNQDAIAAERAATKANELAEAYKETKQAYDELKESIADYENMQTALAKLKEGTEEWRDAIQESNELVMNLLDKYPELAEYVEAVNGQLKITDWNKVLELYQDKTAAAYNNSLNANAAAKKAKNRADKTEFVRTLGDYYTFENAAWHTVNRAAEWAIGGALAGSAIAPGYGTAVGAVGGLVVGALGGIHEAGVQNQNAGDIMENALSKISAAYQEDSAIFANFGDTLTKLNITNEALVENLKRNEEVVKELIIAEKEALEYEKMISQQKVDNLLTSQGFRPNDNYTEHVQDLVRQKYESEVEKYREGKYNSDDWHAGGWSTWWSLGIAENGTDAGKTAAQEYANKIGYEDFEVTNFKGDKIEFTYKKDGKEEKSDVTYEEMERYLSEYAVQQEDELIKYATRINKTISDLKKGSSLNQGVGSFLTEGNFDYVLLSEEEQERILNGFIPPEITGQMLEDFGYYTGENLNAAMQKALENYDPVQVAANIARRTAQEVNTIFQTASQSLEVSTDALEMYAQHLVETNSGLEKNSKLAAQAAVQHFKMAKSLLNLKETFEENVDILEQANENSLDYYEALGKVNQAVEDVFGVKVSAEFTKKNLKELKKMAEGDVEAFNDLRDAVNEDFILNLNINDIAKTALVEKISELSNLADKYPIGTPLVLDDSQALAALNEALYTGEATIEQIESMFNNANLQMPEYNTHWVEGEVTKSVSKTVTKDPILGLSWTTESETTTTAQKAIPYFGDTPPSIDKETGKVTSYGGGGSVSVKSLGNINSQVSELNYVGDSDGEKEEKDNKKKYEDEIERYHVIDKTLEALNAEYDKIQKAKDRAFGQKYLDYLDAEIKKTGELAEATKTKLAEAEEYLAKDREALMKYGISLDENGTITNYEEVIKAQIDQYNSDPENYEEGYEIFQQQLENYEDSLSMVRDLESQVEDYINQEFDLKLSGIQYKVDLQIRLSENDQKLIDFIMGGLEDSVDDALKKFELLGRQMANTEENANAAVEGIRETLGLSELSFDELMTLSPEAIASMLEGKNLTEEQIAQLEGQLDTLYEQVEIMREMYDEVSENLLSAFEDMNEEFEESISNLEHMNSLISSFYDIVDLVGEKTLGINKEMLSSMKRTQLEISKSQMSVNKSQLEQNKESLKAIEEALANADSEAEKKELQEAYDEMLKTVQENEEAYLDSVTTTLEAVTAAFEQEMDNTLSAFESSMTGAYKTFESLREAYDQRKEIDDLYLKDYQKIYELSKLNRDIVNSIDESDSIKAKERLRDLQEEINALQESNSEMTQYEVDILRAKYELRLAEIALEEAQNAKSQVRMQRDANGNWGYVYTADSEAIDTAQQNYEDKLYAYQEIIDNNIEEMEDRLVNLPQEYADAAREIFEKYGDDTELYNLKMTELTEHYLNLQEHILSQLGKSFDDAATLREEDWANYSRLTGYKISADEQWIDKFEETIAAQITGLTTLGDWQEQFEQGTGDVLRKLTLHYDTYQQEVKEILEEAFGDIEEFFGADDNSGLRYYLKMAQKYSQDTAEEAKKMGQANADAFKKAVDAANEWLDKYADKITEWNNTTASIGTTVGEVEKAYALLRAELNKLEDKYEKIEEKAKRALDAMKDVDSYKGDKTLEDPPEEETSSTIWQDPTYVGYESADRIILTSSSKTRKTADGRTYVSYISDADNQEYWADLAGLEKHSTLSREDGMRVYTINDGINMIRYKFEEDNSTIAPNTFTVKDSNMPALTRYRYTSGESTMGAGYLPEGVYVDWTDPLSPGVYTYEKAITWNDREYGYLKYSGTNNYVSGKADNKAPYRENADLFDKSTLLKYYSFDTGGYTGSWDSSGRIAMLHQKELVLNAKDTVNFLNAVDILRDITKVIDLQALSQSNIMGALTAASVTPAGQVIEQSVTIHAEFPNATDHSEIEEAFSTLLNRASQFANRKN